MDKKNKTLGKWSPSWEGPWKILRVFSNNAYEVEELVVEYQPLLLEIKITQD